MFGARWPAFGMNAAYRPDRNISLERGCLSARQLFFKPARAGSCAVRQELPWEAPSRSPHVCFAKPERRAVEAHVPGGSGSKPGFVDRPDRARSSPALAARAVSARRSTSSDPSPAGKRRAPSAAAPVGSTTSGERIVRSSNQTVAALRQNGAPKRGPRAARANRGSSPAPAELFRTGAFFHLTHSKNS